MERLFVEKNFQMRKKGWGQHDKLINALIKYINGECLVIIIWIKEKKEALKQKDSNQSQSLLFWISNTNFFIILSFKQPSS